MLVEDWCQPVSEPLDRRRSHSGRTARCTRAEATARASLSSTGVRTVSPPNPCGDPPGGVGTALSPPTAEGGSLRSQDLRRPSGDPVTLDGTIIRVDPATGAAPPEQPAARRIPIRTPAGSSRTDSATRSASRSAPVRARCGSGTSDWTTWEEINRITSPTDGCGRELRVAVLRGSEQELELRQRGSRHLREPLRRVRRRHEAVLHVSPRRQGRAGRVVPGRELLGVGHQLRVRRRQHPYPSSFDDALFFADYSRDCIWVMKKGADGHPAPGLIETLVADAANPVVLESSGLEASSTTPTSTAARSVASTTRPVRACP